MEPFGMEGWLLGAVLLALPFVILTVFVKLFLAERLPSTGHIPQEPSGTDEPFEMAEV
jgi:hypothetical protein